MDDSNYTSDINKENQNLREIIEVAKQVSSGLDIKNIIKNVDFIISSKFNPSFKAFILKNDIDDPTPIIYIYEAKGVEKRTLNFNSINTLIKFFENQEFNQISYDEFCKTFSIKEVIEELDNYSCEFMIPLKSFKSTLGVYMQGIKDDKTQYSMDDIQFCVDILSFASIALDNAYLFREATVDRMTKLYTHHQFQERLDKEVKRGQRYDTVFSIIMFDIDHFKKFNDRYGHLQGDIIIKEIAKILLESTREVDLPARYGGEEFILLLPEINIDQAYIVAERMRERIEDYAFPGKAGLYKVTISAGVVQFNKKKDQYNNDIIERVDKALYKSKKNGRNRVTKVKY